MKAVPRAFITIGVVFVVALGVLFYRPWEPHYRGRSRRIGFLCLLLWPATITRGVEASSSPGTADDILKQYLALPGSARTDAARASDRMARLDVLRALGGTSNALATIQKALPSVTNVWQRAELAEVLGRYVQTKESASVLVDLLSDPHEQVRGEALHGLRLMAARIDRGGRVGIQAEPAHAPKVDGLVPTLVPVAADPSSQVREAALYALADTREPQAIAEIKAHLGDEDQGVRFQAACLLTEVKDASGIDELKKALQRLRQRHQENYPYHEAEQMMLAFERITGKSFGEVPMLPSLSSDLRQIDGIIERYHSLVQTWAAWWDWMPPSK